MGQALTERVWSLGRTIGEGRGVGRGEQGVGTG